MGVEQIMFLTGVAAAGVIHTIIGPDHYLPLITLAGTRGWSPRKTFFMTLVCGAGHILSSILLGILLMALRFSLTRLELINTYRTDVAAWLLMACGILYVIWGMKDARRGKEPDLRGAYGALLTVFVIGPCEPLFLLVAHPAVAGNTFMAVLSVGIFSVVTVATMLAAVLAGAFGFGLKLRRWPPQVAYAMPGLAMILGGVGMLLV